jgi:beta-glucosidase/6-phospho-beta-glucosidase/beta-galactosidase
MTPFGIRKMQNFINKRYANMTLFVTENGWGDPDLTIA